MYCQKEHKHTDTFLPVFETAVSMCITLRHTRPVVSNSLHAHTQRNVSLCVWNSSVYLRRQRQIPPSDSCSPESDSWKRNNVIFVRTFTFLIDWGDDNFVTPRPKFRSCSSQETLIHENRTRPSLSPSLTQQFYDLKTNSLPNPQVRKMQSAIEDKTAILASSSTSPWSEHEMISMILF